MEKIKSLIESADEGKIAEFILDLADGKLDGKVDAKLAEKIGEVQDAIESNLEPKLLEKVLGQIGLPRDIVDKAKEMASVVNDTHKSVTEKIDGMASLVAEFQSRLEGIDLNKTVTMTYGEILHDKAKYAAYWAFASFLCGMASMLMILYTAGLL